uniref:Uncharacterized protein n=1 Tax=Anopheles stephensi TaxID=30069 RepID=A0A182YFC7_ANOST
MPERWAFSLVVVTMLSSVHRCNVVENVASPEGRVVGSEQIEVTQSDLPYVCSLRLQTGRHRCCATILNPNWLLTSGHCTADLAPDAIAIVCGIRMYRIVSAVVPHPNFDASQWTGHDLALMATVPILSSCECQQRLGPMLSTYLADVNICTDNAPATLPTVDGTSTCVGDSGAPVMIATELQPYNLFAIPSWTVAPCGAGPSVHVRVAPHLDWILTTIVLGVFWQTRMHSGFANGCVGYNL